MKRFLVLAILTLGLAAGAYAEDSGAVSTGTQRFSGTKIWRDLQLTDSTLTGAGTLYVTSTKFQRLDPGGSSRNVTLPAEEDNGGMWFYIINSADAAENLVIKDDAGNTIVTIQQSQAAFVSCSGTAWKGFAHSANGGGELMADGSVAGATGQAQDFGTNGIKADVIAESSAGVGITADGVKLKDGNVYIKDSALDNTLQITSGTNEAGNYTVTIPDLAGNDTLATLAVANVFTGNQTFPNTGMLLKDTGGDHTTNIKQNSDEGANRTLNIPALGGDDTVVTLGTAQSVTGVKTHTGNLIAGNTKLWVQDTGGDHKTNLKQNSDEAADRTLNIPALGGDDTLMTLATAQTVTGAKTMSGANIIKFANTGLTLNDAGSDHVLTLKTATDEAGSYNVVIPDLAGNDTLATLAVANTFTGNNTFPNTGLLLKDTGGDHTTNIKQNSDEAGNRTLNIPALGGNDTLMTLGVPGTVTGNITFSGSVIRTGQRYRQSIAGAKVGTAAGFVVGAATDIFAATCPASQTGAKLIIPVQNLHVGDTITAFGLLGQIESAGNAVTVDADLRKSTAAAADFSDASVSTITQISVNADTKIDSTQDKTGLSQAVAQDEMYYIVVTVTTNAATDVDIRGISIVVSQN